LKYIFGPIISNFLSMYRGSLAILIWSFLLMGNIYGQNPDSLHTKTAPTSQTQQIQSSNETPENFSGDTTSPFIKQGVPTGLTSGDTIPPADSLESDPLTREADSLTGETDSLPVQSTTDTVRITLRDTVQITKRDTITQYLLDVLMAHPTSKMDSAIAYVQQHGVKDTASLLSDTARTMLQRFLYYAKSYPEDSTKIYIKENFQNDSLVHFFQDSAHQPVNDSLNHYLDYLWQRTRKDSVAFTIYNKARDSVKLWLKRNPRDSSRFLIYDDKDYPAGIWIHPRNKKSIQLSFGKNVRIEEVETQQTLREYLPVTMEEIGLKQQQEVDMIFPQWDIDGIGRAHFNQGYITNNWARGGESSMSTLWTIRYSADYKKGKTIWDNDLEYKIGLLKSGEKSLRKNEDKLEINSKFGSNARKNWYYSTLLNFQTQFFKGYDYPDTDQPISGFLAPSYLVFSVGMDYKPSDKLTLLLSPISSKFTMMRDTTTFDQTNFGISKNRKSKKELGAYVKSIFTLDITPKISMENKVNFFINYLGKKETLDVDYEMTLNMEINRLINTTINTHLVYDRDISRHIQFKENLSVGMEYKF